MRRDISESIHQSQASVGKRSWRRGDVDRMRMSRMPMVNQREYTGQL